MKTMKITIDKESIRKVDKSERRKILVEMGVYNRPTHKVHKGVKDYSRKVKHKKSFLES